MDTVNAQYNVARPDSLPIKIAGYQRRKMFAVFLRASGIAPDDSVADIGVTSDRSYHHSNYFEAWYPHKSRITAVGLDEASFLERNTPESNLCGRMAGTCRSRMPPSISCTAVR